MADSAELSIDKALEDLNVSKEKQKIILIGSRKQLSRRFLLDVMLRQFCPLGSAKAKTEDNSWLLNSEGNRNCIFVERRRQTLLYCYKWGWGKQFILRKIRKTTAIKQVNNCPKQVHTHKQGNLIEIKTDRNPTITNHKKWPFEVLKWTSIDKEVP